MMAGRFRTRRCVVEGVEAVEADTAHRFGRHTHEHFGIGLIVRGAQTSASGRGPVEAGPGDVITVNPGEVHDGAPIDAAGRAWRMLYLDPRLIAEASLDIQGSQSSDFVFSHPVISDARTVQRFQAVYSTMTACEGTIGPETELLRLLATLLCKSPSIRPVSAGIGQARSLIDDDPSASITLHDLAEASGLSRFQVVRGFAGATGMTPHAYLVQRRIGLARRLIAKGTSLAEAAFAAGFADQSHMTRIFVRVYGVTPGTYAQAFS